MKKDSLRIAVGGKQRLREAVEARVRRAHQDQLSGAIDAAQKAATEATIQSETLEEMKRVSSPYSLWSSR